MVRSLGTAQFAALRRHPEGFTKFSQPIKQYCPIQGHLVRDASSFYNRIHLSTSELLPTTQLSSCGVFSPEKRRPKSFPQLFAAVFFVKGCRGQDVRPFATASASLPPVHQAA